MAKDAKSSASYKVMGLASRSSDGARTKETPKTKSGWTVIPNGQSGHHIIPDMHTGSYNRSTAITPVEKQVSASTLHRDTRPTLDLLQTSDAVAVTHYNRIEGFLVAPTAYAALVERAEGAGAFEDELASTVTLLLAAAHTGVPMPSDLLERVLPDVDIAERWREIAEFAATFPVRISVGEGGEPITRASLSHTPRPIEEYGTDDDLDLG